MPFFFTKSRKHISSLLFFGLLLLVFTPKTILAQDWTYTVTGKVKKMGKTLEGAVVTLFKNGNQIQQIVTSKNGKFDLVLEPDNEYILQVTKPGHIVKKIIFDMRNVPPERGKYGFAAFIIEEINIFEYPQGVDKGEIDALTAQPIALVKYDPKAENFDYDRLYTKQRKKDIDKINELQKKVEQNPNNVVDPNNNGQVQLENQYNLLIQTADALFKGNDFVNAKSKYEEASKLKSDQQYPKDQIKLCDEKIKQEQANKQYNDLIKASDEEFKNKSYQTARNGYFQASQLKPNEQYPKDKMAECDKLIAEQKEIETKYKQFIDNGNTSYNQKMYNIALASFKEATKLKPNENYPKDKIKEIEKIIAEQEKEQKYKDAIKKGDDAFAKKDWTTAKAGFTEASGLKPDEKYPKDKLAEIEKLLQDEKLKQEQDKKYNDLIVQADKQFTAKDYTNAKNTYNQALGIKSGEQYPKDQIAKIDKLLADIEKQKDIDLKYNSMMQEANNQFAQGDYNNAKSKYKEASNLKPNEQLPKDKIIECDKKLAEKLKQEELDKKYNDAITKGDDAFAKQDWITAKMAYTTASTLKPSEQYPKDKLAEIEKKIKEGNVDKMYQDAIAKADKLFADKNYAGAKTTYQSASTIKPSEQYPKDKIAECDKLLGDMALEQKYKDAITKGDAAFALKNWSGAKTAYTDASGIKPNEKYPKDKLAEIEKILNDEKNKTELEKKYKDLIVQADKQFLTKDYINAKATYNEALGIKSGEKYPTDQIAKIDKILADGDKQKELDAKYAQVMADADKLFASGDYANAKTKYAEASGLKPLEILPKNKMAECDKLLADKLKKEELDKKYNDAITKGDDAFAKQDWITAKMAYTTASTLKPSEQYPKDKLAEIEKKIKEGNVDKMYQDAIAKADKLFADKNYAGAKTTYQSASSIKPNEQYPKDKIAECDKILNEEKLKLEQEQKYKDLIVQADKQFGLKDYSNAKNTYTQALGIKSGEQYPKDQIAKIDALLGDLNKQKELDAQYTNLMSEGDKLFASKNYVGAKGKYTEALGLKPNEKLPKDKIAECDKLINATNTALELQKKYDEAIKNGDANFKSAEYATAKQFYTEASGLKPTEKYPKDKLAEIEKLLADKKKHDELDKKYNDALASADKLFADKDYKNAKIAYQGASTIKPSEQYPKDQISKIDKLLADVENEKLNAQKYADAIKIADKLLASKDYVNAKSKYTEASGYKPSEQYPKDKIAEIDAILKKIEEDKTKVLSQKELNDKYVALINKGDVAYAKKDYYTARDAFTEALGLMPNQQYPKMRLEEINKIIKKLEEQDAQLKAYQDAIAKADLAFNEKRYADALELYNTASGMKPNEQYPKDRINEINAIIKTQQNNQQQSELLKEYAKYIKLGDEAFQQKNYEKAKINYKLALTKQPNEQYPKDRLDKIELLLNNKPNKDTTTVVVKVNPNDPTEKARRYKEYLAKYGKGITEKPETQEQNKKVLTVYVVTDTEADEYKRVIFNYGAVFYYKNGIQIPQSEFSQATNIQ